MVITETRLDNIANGYIDPERLKEPFIITRSHESLKKMKEGAWCYTFIWGKEFSKDFEPKQGVEITPQTAKKLIKIYNMTIAHKTDEGQIYEKPGNPFKKAMRS